jgi:hypothetical protein
MSARDVGFLFCSRCRLIERFAEHSLDSRGNRLHLRSCRAASRLRRDQAREGLSLGNIVSPAAAARASVQRPGQPPRSAPVRTRLLLEAFDAVAGVLGPSEWAYGSRPIAS